MLKNINKAIFTGYFKWTIASPLLAWALYLSGLISFGNIFIILAVLFLILSILSAVHHSEVVAHKVGEPFGTIILAIAITIIEVAIIISLMVSGGAETAALPRDTVFAATMIILNGILGICLTIGGLKHKEQKFSMHAANTSLISLIAILVFTLILPNYTTSVNGPVYSEPQLIFISIACLVIYGAFLTMQTVRHRDYFRTDDTAEGSIFVSGKQTAVSLILLVTSLLVIVLLAKKLSPELESYIIKANLPKSLVGVLIAFVILLPEGIAALKAARADRLQTSLNLALGSALASIGLTIPAVAIVSIIFKFDLIMGIDTKSIVLLGLSFFITLLSLSKGKTNLMYGIVLLVNLAAYIFTIIFS